MSKRTYAYVYHTKKTFIIHILWIFFSYYKNKFYKLAKTVNCQMWYTNNQICLVHSHKWREKCLESLMKLSQETGPIPDNLIKSFTSSSNKLATLWRRFVFNSPFYFSCECVYFGPTFMGNPLISSDECEYHLSLMLQRRCLQGKQIKQLIQTHA